MHDDTPIQLTPLLCLTVSLLYMIKSDGVIDDHESSQIQSVLGGQEEILALGLDYVASTPVDEFLAIAAPLLSQKDIWCILTNVCDSVLSDGVVSDDEQALFVKICNAFEVSEKDFAPYNRALRFKNNKQNLGVYSLEALTSPFPPAHLSLAACLLYMMAADGDIAEEEIGQLQVVIGEFEGLQEVAMQQVRCMKSSQFLRAAVPYLTEEQKLFTLVNVYDSMLSDGIIKDKEQVLFESMQDAFAISNHKLAPFLKAIELKNHKPKLTQIDKDAIHIRQKRLEEAKDDWNAATSVSSMGKKVQRTIDQNNQQVSEGFNSQEEIDLVALNANNSDARIKVKEKALKSHVQQIDLDTNSANIQQVALDSTAANIQQVGLDASAANIQQIENDSALANRQALPDDHLKSEEPQFFVDSRMDSLQMSVTQVHRQLDLITPRSTWQKLDAFFQQRPVALDDVEPLENPPLSGLTSTSQTPDMPAPEGAVEFTTDGFSMHEFSADDSSEDLAFTGAGNDGGIRLRSLLLVVGISIPLVGFAYGLIYPTMVCQGPSHQWQKWTPDDEEGSTRIINEQTTNERHLIQIRRGEINVTNQRFPLYKELNQSNHFAQQTDKGFKGSYSTHTVDQMKYAFEFTRHQSQLRIETESAGIRYIEGQSGHIEVFSVFKGSCENRWF